MSFCCEQGKVLKICIKYITQYLLFLWCCDGILRVFGGVFAFLCMLLYIDTLALLYRAYYAVPGLVADDGTPTGALFGLTNSLFRIIAEMEPDHIIACFDRPEETFRQQSHQEYKANREIPEEDMIAQIELSREMLQAYGVHTVEKAGYEADDLLGTLALADAKNGGDVVIVSCDGDLLQLTVHSGVRVYFLRKGMADFVLYDEKEVEKKNGYPAANIIDYKGLAGDSSDNITGVPGIGDTYAKRLLAAFGDLDGIYAALAAGSVEEKGFTKRVVTLLTQGRESAFVSRELATIHTDVPVVAPHKKAKVWKERVVYADARAMLDRFGFSSLFARLNVITGVGSGSVASSSQKKKDTSGTLIDEDSSDVSAVDASSVRAASVALWVLDATRTNASFEDVCAHTDTHDPAAALAVIEKELQAQNLLSVWKDIEQPLLPVIERMEQVGVCFDVAGAKKLSAVYTKKVAALTKKIHKLAGKEFNISSPKQLGEVLYGDLALKPKRASKTATGGKTTKESVLLQMVDDHPIVSLVLEYRHYEKLRSTYVDALPDCVADDGRIHTTLQQNGTVTGRFSSKDPNLQNIPIGGDDGTAIRDLFIAADGWEMVAIDYSQVELRLAAILSQDKALLEVFQQGVDVHQAVAARMFSVSREDVTPEQRNSAKAINFGVLYGMGSQSLSRSLQVPLLEADAFLADYKKAFPALFDYLAGIKKEVSDTGFVTTAFGRVRPIAGIHSSLAYVKAQAERTAANTVIQGTAADIIKLAMIDVDKMLEKEGLANDVRMLLQIHDELLFEVRPQVADAAVDKIVEVMESIYPKDGKPIRLLASVGRGKSWGSLKE